MGIEFTALDGGLRDEFMNHYMHIICTFFSGFLSLSIYIYIYTHTHTHTHIYIYIFLHKNFSPANDLRSKLVANNIKINNSEEIFIFFKQFCSSLSLYIYIYIYIHTNSSMFWHFDTSQLCLTACFIGLHPSVEKSSLSPVSFFSSSYPFNIWSFNFWKFL